MKKRSIRNSKKSRSENLNYQSLELRQVLTSFLAIDSMVFHLPQDGELTVIQNLDAAPDIVQQPEHGKLRFEANSGDDGTLTYYPDNGFTGKDSFLISDAETEYTLRVWEPVYAVADWTHIQPGTSTSIDALANDYAMLNTRNASGAFRVFDSAFQWQQDATGFTIVEFTSDSSATVSISADGKSIDYTAADGFDGTDLVTYTLEDANGHRSTATITIEVSSETENGNRYFSESQWLHQKIDAWLEKHSSSLLRESVFQYVWGGGFFTRGSEGFNGNDELSLEVNFANVAVDSDAQFDQVANVQEGDIVKSQGDLLYYVTHATDDGEFESYLSIVDFSDPTSPEIVSTTGFEQRIRDVYLDDGRAAIILDQTYAFDPSFRPLILDGYSYLNESDFHLVVLDVSDSATPAEVYRATIEGRYTDARLIGDELYIVSGTPDSSGPSPWTVFGNDSDFVPVSPGDFVDAILAMDDGGFTLPSIVAESGGNTQTITVDIKTAVKRDDNYSATMVTTFGLQDDTGVPLDIDLVESGSVGTVYVSTNAMYLFDGISAIKLNFNDDSGVEFVADGRLEGNLLGQLAVDEHEGYLRVAITNWTSEVSVHVIEQMDESLEIVSSLNDIAPGESIYATHFSGDQAFVVTFRQVDPLFVIDLSNPTAATISGELTIPGFSNYLHLIGDDLLMAVGRGADPTTGLFNSLQVSLFDISDSSSPQLLDRYSFEGDRSTATPLVDWFRGAPNHHALTFDPTTGTLALPIYSNAWSGDGIFEGNASAMSLFEIDRANGIVASGQVDFESRALRTAVVGDHFVYLSQDGLQTASRTSPTVVLSELALPTVAENARIAQPVLLVGEDDRLQDPEPEELVDVDPTAEEEAEPEQADFVSDEIVPPFIGPIPFEFFVVDRDPDVESERDLERVPDFSNLSPAEQATEDDDLSCSRFSLSHIEPQRDVQQLSGAEEFSFSESTRLNSPEQAIADFETVAPTTLDSLFADLEDGLTDFAA